MPRWEYCSLQLERKLTYRTGAVQTYRGVKVDGEKRAGWELRSTLRLPGGDIRKDILEQENTLVDLLNKLGWEGWELSGVLDESDAHFEQVDVSPSSHWTTKSLVFRRPVT